MSCISNTLHKALQLSVPANHLTFLPLASAFMTIIASALAIIGLRTLVGSCPSLVLYVCTKMLVLVSVSDQVLLFTGVFCHSLASSAL